MTDDPRPDPDALLAAINKAEARQQRGHLKIFFGMAAGVGKTYAMLEAALQRQADGVEVVIGYVETHGRAETEAMLVGLPQVARQQLEYRGAQFEEMDLDAILTRHPPLVLVDELAHTNIPGARHPKRYQDVLELLDAGIDVYTTINVQHLESRADTVRQITGITVRETVPDSILELADEIELVDLAPEELQKRLAEGKVYLGEQAEAAAQHFFRTGNLTALREMALRLTAERVDHQLQDYMQLKQIAGPWKSGERLMVAISPSPLSERLVRWTRRMAYNLEASWLAVYVETPQTLSADQQAQLARNLDLARELGGEVITTAGEDVISALLRVARQRNVTQVVVGKPVRARLRETLTGGSLVNRLIRLSGSIDVYVVTGDETETSGQPIATRPVLHSNLRQYVAAVLVVAGVTGLNLLATHFINYRAVALVYLFAVLLIGLFVGRGPVLVAAALSAMLWNFLFIPPQLTITISAFDDVLMFGMYFIAALATGQLTARLARARACRAASRRARDGVVFVDARSGQRGNDGRCPANGGRSDRARVRCASGDRPRQPDRSAGDRAASVVHAVPHRERAQRGDVVVHQSQAGRPLHRYADAGRCALSAAAHTGRHRRRDGRAHAADFAVIDRTGRAVGNVRQSGRLIDRTRDARRSRRASQGTG